MNNTITREDYKQQLTSLQETLPVAPFPRKHIHSVFDRLQDATQARFTLLEAGYEGKDIHILTSRDYAEAVEQGQTFISFLAPVDLDEYQYEARRGRHILAVRVTNYEQMRQIRDMLVPHHAHLMKYIDTWTVTDLVP